MVCTRAFKFSHRTAWMMGSDQTFVDMGIMAFQDRFRFGFQMERLLLLCFICGVLGLGETNCLKYFGAGPEKAMVSWRFLRIIELLAMVGQRRKD